MIVMTFEEYRARKLWDTDMMTEEEKEAHIARIRSHCGVIDDETFVEPLDVVPVIAKVS